MKKKLSVLLIVISAIILVIAFDFKNRHDISNIVQGLDYGYKDFCSEEFLSVIDSKVYTVFGSYSKKKKLLTMIEDNSCYKHNGITPSIYVYTPDSDGIFLEKTKGYINSEVVYIDPDGNQIVDYEAKIKVRGNSTAIAPKKPYNIKFSEKQDLMGFGSAKKWNLLADCFDPTLIRNKMFLDLALELGLDNTSNAQYAELYVDGIYRGCYLLTEAVEVGKNRVDINVENGDFLVEYESDREEEDVTYMLSKHGIRLAMSDPEDLDEKQYKKIAKIIDEFDRCLFSNDYKQVESIIDVDSFVKVYLVNEFAKTADFGTSSVYFYYKDGKMYAGPVWDFDLSSGNFDGEEEPQKGYWTDLKGENVSYKDFFCREYNVVYNKLLSYPEVEAKYKKLFEEKYDLLKNIYEKDGYIDQTLKTYGWLFDNNYLNADKGGAGWKVGTKYINIEITPLETYDKNLDYLLTWLENRLNWLKENS